MVMWKRFRREIKQEQFLHFKLLNIVKANSHLEYTFGKCEHYQIIYSTAAVVSAAVALISVPSAGLAMTVFVVQAMLSLS